MIEELVAAKSEIIRLMQEIECLSDESWKLKSSDICLKTQIEAQLPTTVEKQVKVKVAFVEQNTCIRYQYRSVCLQRYHRHKTRNFFD